MKHIEHTFGPGETIQAVIRKYNRQNMPDAIVNELTVEYKNINEKHVPRVGDTAKIPVYRFVGKEEPVKQNLTVRKVPVHKPNKTPRRTITPPPFSPTESKTKAEVIPLPKRLEDLDPKEVKVEDEILSDKAMMERMKRRKQARMEKGKIVPETTKSKPKVEEIPVDITVEEISEEVKEIINELGKDPQIEIPTDPILQNKKVETPKSIEKKTKEEKKPKSTKPVEKKKKVEENKKDKPKISEERKKQLEERRKNRRKKDIDTAKLLNRMNRHRRRR